MVEEKKVRILKKRTKIERKNNEKGKEKDIGLRIIFFLFFINGESLP